MFSRADFGELLSCDWNATTSVYKNEWNW